MSPPVPCGSDPAHATHAACWPSTQSDLARARERVAELQAEAADADRRLEAASQAHAELTTKATFTEVPRLVFGRGLRIAAPATTSDHASRVPTGTTRCHTH